MDYRQYEKEVEKIKEENDKYLNLFAQELEKAGLTKKTIEKHLLNACFYINDYLLYYQPKKMVEGCYHIDYFLSDWLIRKTLWSSSEQIKSYCASLKKFYKVMLELGYIEKKDFLELNMTIKDEKASWLAAVKRANDMSVD